jgi:ADP-ribosylglycohydrolase
MEGGEKMAVTGAILGDIAGSQYEGRRCRDYRGCDIFTERCSFTDDTVTTLSVKYAIDRNIPFAEAFKEVGRRYPNCGYAQMYEKWVFSDSMEPYGSWGNGSAMRVSYIGEKYETLREVQQKARESAEVTHNDPEGIKGAVVTAACIWMARHGKTKKEIYAYVLAEYPPGKYEYSIDMDMEYLRDEYEWDVSCQGSVPVAMRCFYESDSYESFLRNVFSLACDCDTLCCIGGGVAEEFYKGTGFDADRLLERYLTKDLLQILRK